MLSVPHAVLMDLPDGVTDALPTSIAVYGTDLRIRFLNTPARQAIRLPAGVTDPIGVHLEHLNYPPQLLATVRQLIEATVATGQSHVTRLDSPRTTGPRHFQVTMTPLLVDGVVDAVCSVATDITAIHDAHRALAEQEARFQAAMRSAGVYEWGRDTRTGRLTVSDEFLGRLGLRRDALPAGVDGWRAWFHPEDWPVPHLRAVAEGRTDVLEFEFRATGFDGVTRWFLTRGTVDRDASGTPTGANGVTVDITARKRAELDLAASREVFHRFMTHCPAAAWIKGADGRYEFANPRLEANAGRPADAIVGRTTEEVFPSDVADVYVAHDRRVLTTGEAVTEVELAREPDGRERPCLVVRFPLDDGEDAPTGRRLGGFSLDISELHRLQQEQRKVEQQMLQAQKLESLGVLAGGIAHDFNNLLTGVLGYASLARMDGHLSADTDGHLKQIEAAAQRAGELCKQMLAYAGRGQFVVGEVGLNAVVVEMSQLLAAAVSKRAVLKFNLTDPLPPVRADATQLRQVAMNLITNASDAIAERSGVITVSTGLIDADPVYLADIGCQHLPPRTYVYLEVSDTGVGMPEEVKARVFEPFFTTKFTGRGLGLAAVQGIVRAHGGAIKIYTQVGKGTTFKVLLPASDAAVDTAAAVPLLPAVAGAGRCVLVVDDEEDVRVLARKVLTAAGFQVETAADGRDGVETFRAAPHRYAAVLLDLTMPRMNGVEAFRQMRVIRQDVRVILTSGYAAEDATTGFEGKGLVAFVRKPFRVGELLAAVAEAVRG